jgi:hypothetical protein
MVGSSRFSEVPVVNVTTKNVKDIWPSLALAVKTSTFVALDLVGYCECETESMEFYCFIFCSAHIHSVECSWCLADVLTCSQKVSHPEMRLTSPSCHWHWRIMIIIPFSLLRTLCMLVSVCFHNLVTYAHRLQDLYSTCLMF